MPLPKPLYPAKIAREARERRRPPAVDFRRMRVARPQNSCMKKIILCLSLLLLIAIAARGDVINIVDEGAVPNDGIDDTAAIQQAINVAAASTTTRTVYAPCGTYDVDGQLTITTSGISFVGESPSC